MLLFPKSLVCVWKQAILVHFGTAYIDLASKTNKPLASYKQILVQKKLIFYLWFLHVKEFIVFRAWNGILTDTHSVQLVLEE